jgi:uncharacterized membrane protein
MKRLKHFIKTTLLGGVIVILPVVLTFYFLRWSVGFVSRLIAPIAAMLMERNIAREYIYAAQALAVSIIIAACFFTGLAVKTRMGGFVFHTIEKRILKIAPGYTLFKETIKQFLGQERTPFSSVALVQIFENSTLMTGFITDEHPEGYYTVYVPSGLNPTTGMIYHLEKKYVHIVDVTVEETMRSIFGCGAGSKKLVDKWLELSRTKPVE